MKIYLIRHAKVNMEWPQKCDSKAFDLACEAYDTASIVPIGKWKEPLEYEKLYVSQLERTHATAQGLFPGAEWKELPVYEVPLKSYRDSSKQKPLWIWNVLGRLQWFFNQDRQDEVKKDTIKRCMQVIQTLEEANENCVIVTHGFFLKTFVKCLQKRGFSISGERRMQVENLQLITADK